jgi:hypothetical protein
MNYYDLGVMIAFAGGLLIGCLIGTSRDRLRNTASLLRLEDECAHAARRDRLKQLAPGQVERIHNCGRILHVDYAKGEIVVERGGR